MRETLKQLEALDQQRGRARPAPLETTAKANEAAPQP
jgi:hypothetical protein